MHHQCVAARRVAASKNMLPAPSLRLEVATMRKSFGLLAAGFCALSIAGPASGVLLPFTGSLGIEINAGLITGGPGGYSVEDLLLTVVIPGSGAAAVNGSGIAGHLTALGLAGGEFATVSLVLPVTDPWAYPFAGVQITAGNGAATFAGAGGDAFGGVMPMNGVMKVCLFATCSGAVANVEIPLSVVGKGGTASFFGPINLTVKGAPWTTGTAAIGTMTRMGGVSPLSNTGAPGGSMNLVTPIFISTNVPPYLWPAFGILSLDFIPEPATLLLGGTAIASLVAVGFVRSRRAN
jgi:hypothetical protein